MIDHDISYLEHDLLFDERDDYDEYHFFNFLFPGYLCLTKLLFHLFL